MTLEQALEEARKLYPGLKLTPATARVWAHRGLIPKAEAAPGQGMGRGRVGDYSSDVPAQVAAAGFVKQGLRQRFKDADIARARQFWLSGGKAQGAAPARQPPGQPLEELIHPAVVVSPALVGDGDVIPAGFGGFPVGHQHRQFRRALEAHGQAREFAQGGHPDPDLLQIGGGDTTTIEGIRSDTILLVNIPADRSRVVAVSWPRDLQVDRPDCAEWDPATGAFGAEIPAAEGVKLNSVYAVGGPPVSWRVRCFVLSFIASPITAFLSMVISYLVVKRKFRAKGFIEFVSILAMAVPGTVLGVGEDGGAQVVEQDDVIFLGTIDIARDVRESMRTLRDYLYNYVYPCETIHREIENAKKVLRELYAYLLSHPPEQVRCEGDPTDSLERKIVDFIAGMTDPYAMELYTRYLLPAAWKT